MLTQLYLGENFVFVFEYTGHPCTDIHTHLEERRDKGGKQTNMVEYFILVYNSRFGKKYGRVKGDVSFF